MDGLRSWIPWVSRRNGRDLPPPIFGGTYVGTHWVWNQSWEECIGEQARELVGLGDALQMQVQYGRHDMQVDVCPSGRCVGVVRIEYNIPSVDLLLFVDCVSRELAPISIPTVTLEKAKMLGHLPLLLLFTSLSTFIAASPLALPQTSAPNPPKNTLNVSNVTVDTEADGSGCRPGTVSVAVSEDSSLMTFIFDDFQAAVGPNAGSYRKRALCKVNVTISSPGWAFDVQSVDFRGYVRLAKGVDASIVSRWKWVDVKTGQDLKGKVRDLFPLSHLRKPTIFFTSMSPLCCWGARCFFP